MKCLIFRCSKKQEMYLYVPFVEEEQKAIDALPEGLLKLTGKLVKAMELELAPERKLARADVNEVISSLEQKGFYLQTPPNDILRADDSMLNNSSDGF